MKKQGSYILMIIGTLLFSLLNGQESDALETDTMQSPQKDSIVVGGKATDSLYREDQFYVGLTFNLINDMPSGGHQSGFSGGIHLGFIRDIPLNASRNTALGIGLGWSVNSFKSNLLVSQDKGGNSFFQVLDRDQFNYQKNNFSTQLIEVPLQFRWRTSSASSYKFWRIYTGLRLGYLYSFHAKFKQQDNTIVQTQVENLNRLRYGLTFTFGYNTFNFTVYYSLNPFFSGKTLSGEPVGLTTFKVGLEFYIL